MNQVHEIATTNRERDLFYNMDMLLVPIDYYARLHPSDYAAEEAERQAKEEAKRKAEEAKAAAALSSSKVTAPAPAKAEPVQAAVAQAAEPAKPEPSRAPAAQAGEPDDLKRIEGIGPKIAEALQAAGITTFAQLADTDVERIRHILDEAGPSFKLADPTTWPKQAKLAAAGKWDALGKWQERLKHGKDE
jgi:predicted flap endonuclease-1-like 5' DNA nuclease